MTEPKYEYWLAAIPGIGSGTIRQLLKYAGSARAIYEMSPGMLRSIYGISDKQAARIHESKKGWELDRELEKLWRKQIGFVTAEQEGYPKRLRHIHDAPYGLFYVGALPQDMTFSAAIVGARGCSEYAKQMTIVLARRLADLGAQVISGMARGVDGHAHTGAMDHGGKTFAVLGCGVDVVYPPEHERMYAQILETGGGILSEYLPGTRPRGSLFPPRNRIIAGLSDIVIVSEAREKSGSLITADYALEQGKDVYVVPGRMHDKLCGGSNRLLKQGAGIILSEEDLIGEIGFFSENKGVFQDRLQIPLEKEELKVYSTLDLCPKSMEQVCADTGLSPLEAAVALTSLCDAGLVRSDASGCYQIMV